MFKDWKEYAVHDDKNIKGFFGDYRWLSNFHSCDVYYEGVLYPSSENAYQASKVLPCERPKLVECSPAASKKIWKTLRQAYTSATQWDSVKYEIMASIIFDKFFRNASLRFKLLSTDDKYLEETNSWGDVYWGVDIIKGGKNNLGKLLMRIREFWR